tara:strand:+ start:3886 stop:4512 length:627 start_codon:yes stop_codon:yes gene_type:complete
LTVEQIIYLKKKKAFFEEMPMHCVTTESVFIHIPKSAGMSVVKALYKKDSSNHDTWREYYHRDKSKFEKYFKFAFVRHPYDRFISAYEYLIKGGKSDTDIYWRDKYLSPYSDVNDFILLGGLERAIKGGAEHFIPQVKFVCKGDNIVVDYIARYESINEDFEYIRSKIGGNELSIVNANEVKNKLILTSLSIDKLNSIYSDDYRVFGY